MGNEMSSASGGILGIGPWIISGLALIQVWVIALWRRFRKPVVEIYQSGVIEIGYGSFGPSIGILGTLRTRKRDVFVRNIQLKVVKRKDGSFHIFDWRAFRSSTISVTPTVAPNLEIASSFLLTERNPLKYNIFFVDENFIAEISTKVAQVSRKWNEYKKPKVIELEQQFKKDISALLGNPMFNETLFDDFSKSGQTTEEFTTLDRSCYWEAGEYSLDIIVNTSRPTLQFTESFKFNLSEEDIKQLRLNAIGIIRYLCGLNVYWFFAYPKYQGV
jgi:hypothetical protein